MQENEWLMIGQYHHISTVNVKMLSLAISDNCQQLFVM